MPIDLQTLHPAAHEKFQTAIKDAQERVAQYESAGPVVRGDLDHAIRAHNVALGGDVAAGLQELGLSADQAKALLESAPSD